MRVSALVLVLSATALAEGEGLKQWRAEQRRIEREEAAYWREFQSRMNDALIAWREPLEQADAKPDEHPEATYDYGPWERLYDEFAKLQQARGLADGALARSGDAHAAEALLDAALEVAGRIDAVEKELADEKPKMRRYLFDQRLPVERHGIAYRRSALIEALGTAPGADALLATEGWKKAEKADRRRSVASRTLVLDALAAAKGDEARAQLEKALLEEPAALRVAAVQGLAGFGDVARPVLAAQLDLGKESCAIVRRALLRALLARETLDTRWVPALLDVAETRVQAGFGVEAALAVELLARLTGQRYGYDFAGWRAWLAEYASEIEGGQFDKSTTEVRDVPGAPAPDHVTFYGVRAPSRHVAFVVEGSLRLATPADNEVLKRKIRWLWPGTRSQWEDESPSHQMVLLAELRKTLDAFPAGGSFDLVVMHNRFEADVLNEKGRNYGDPRWIKDALRMVEKLPASGWCSQLEGLRVAGSLGGFDPSKDRDAIRGLDTIFLLDSGDPAGGRYLTPDSVVAAFARWNRFRQLTVHALRIANEKEAAERVMQGIAETSGGSYAWIAKPPE